MEILPSEYQHMELSRSEKIFVRNIMSNEEPDYLLINTNPAMLQNEKMHVLISSGGILFLKFFEGFEDAAQFGIIMPALISGLYAQTVGTISAKLLSNKVLTDGAGKLKFPVNVVYVFPALKRSDVQSGGDEKLGAFINGSCAFKEELQKVRSDLGGVLTGYLARSVVETSDQRMTIGEANINSILQRIAPEYVTIRASAVIDGKTTAGADNELLVITEDDRAVKAFRLDREQINIVNKISKGDQLILACAGAGKSVLLIAKCFKAAAMNPDKQFLMTCYNKHLCSLYTWFIDRAGFKARNVTCLTFHTLCKRLLRNNGYSPASSKFDQWVNNAIFHLNAGHIKEKYYGIFIDEVQQFDPEWYKFCFNLLENKTSGEHLFVICGDKTQKLANLQRHGRAPWNVGEGYPNYRGGNKNIRIERNYRNCIEINEYINRYVSNAKQYLFDVQQSTELDPDEFLRGRSMFHGVGVSIKHLTAKSNEAEARAVLESVTKAHDEHGIPYDEIAVVMYNSSFKRHINGWQDYRYDLDGPLASLLEQEDIPFCRMYGTGESWGARYGDNAGVSLIKFLSVLGLDFRAVIVCGLVPFGEYNGTRNPDWQSLKVDEEKFQDTLKHAQEDVRFLYVACTRAKEVLHIILPETGETSVYAKMLEDAE